MERLARYALLLIAAPLAVHGASADKAALLDQLHVARDLWQHAGSMDYSFTIANGCFCLHPLYAGPVRVVVAGGEVRSTVYVGKPWDDYTTGESVSPTETPLARTIPQLFDDIDNLIAVSNPAFVQASYDARDGHPLLFAYDDPALEDEQTYITVTSFEREAR